MKPITRTIFIEGAAGVIETLVESPHEPRGIALVCHPHPLFGGTRENKVVQIIATTLLRLGNAVLRPNFRGVGASSGRHDQGRGETQDMLVVLDEARRIFGELPVVLAGFSFGGFVQACVAARLAESGQPARRILLVGMATGEISGAGHYATPAVTKEALIIHGSADSTVPLGNVLDWAEPLDLPIIVIPGADHFFHRKLHIIRNVILRGWNL